MKTEITIDVDDLNGAIKFYCQGIGFELIERSKSWARAELNGQTFWICEFAPERSGSSVRNFQRHWTPIHLDFIVDDLDSALARLLEAGGILDREVRRNHPEPLGRCHLANLSDPAGNGIDLVERLG